MSKAMRLEILIILACWIMFHGPSKVSAEKVKPLNPDCGPCPTVIAYEDREAKELIGEKGKKALIRLSALKEKTVKIDLDDPTKTGLENDPDAGYDLRINIYPHLIVIGSIRDSSIVKIYTDVKHLSAPKRQVDEWRPEIQIQPSSSLAIEKTDDLELARQKFENTEIYKIIVANDKQEPWNTRFSRWLVNILDRLK